MGKEDFDSFERLRRLHCRSGVKGVCVMSFCVVDFFFGCGYRWRVHAVLWDGGWSIAAWPLEDIHGPSLLAGGSGTLISFFLFSSVLMRVIVNPLF